MILNYPTRGDVLNDLERLLWRFRMVAHEAQIMLRGFNGYADVSKSTKGEMQFSLSNHAQLIVDKSIEIWDDSGSLAKLKPRIIIVRKCFDASRQPDTHLQRSARSSEHYHCTCLSREE